jgi:UDP-N-acetylglucosamine 4,6-dehydratase
LNKGVWVLEGKFVFETKRILVTGGAGSIGSEIVKRALSESVEKVVACDMDETRLSELLKTVNDDRLEGCIVDIKDIASIERMFNTIGSVDLIFHAAAMKHVSVCEENPIEATLTNIIGTQNIVDAAIRWNVPTCVFVSTDKAVSPQNVLGASKFIAEKIFLKTARKCSNQTFFVVRFGNVANSRGSVVPVLTQSLLQRKEIIITDPDVTRFIMRIEDAVALIFKALDVSVGGEIFVLKIPAFRLGNLADVMINDVAPHFGITPKDVQMRTIGLVKGEKKHEELFGPEEMKRIVDLGDFYGVIDPDIFPKHEKYLGFNFAENIEVSSQSATRISMSLLKDMVFEYVVGLRPQPTTDSRVISVRD